MKPITFTDKKRIAEEVGTIMHSMYGEEADTGSACLQWMDTGLMVLRAHDIEAIPACGSGQFQMRSEVGHDGDTHLSFMWGGGPEPERTVPVSGLPLPEMHCFIWLPKRMEIVDFSVKYLPRFAERVGFKFDEGFVPPDYYWENPNVLAPRAIYIPNVDATKLAIRILRQRKGQHESRR